MLWVAWLLAGLRPILGSLPMLSVLRIIGTYNKYV